jgi:PAS domain S-box-containing protein/putative nucleotidyltransferase with HDIG domain
MKEQIVVNKKTFLEGLPYASVLVDIKSGRIVEINSQAAHLLGKLAADILFMFYWELFPEHLLEQSKDKFSQIKQNARELIRYYSEIRRLDQSKLIPVEVTIKTFNFGQDKAFIYSLLDLSDNEEQLAQNNQFMTKAMQQFDIYQDSNEVLQFILDHLLEITGADAGGIYFVDYQENYLKLAIHSGLSKDFIKDSQFIHLSSEKGRSIIAGNPIYYTKSSNTKKLQREKIKAVAVIPIWYQKKVIASLNLASHQYDYFPVTKKNIIETVVLQIKQIIARIREYQLLKENQENLENIFNKMEDFLFICDNNGDIIKTNLVTRNRLGYSQKEILKKHVLDLHPPYLKAKAKAIFNKMMENKMTVCYLPLMTKTGETIPVESRIMQGKWGNKNVCYGFSRDISLHEESAQRLKERLLFEKVLSDISYRFISGNSLDDAINSSLADLGQLVKADRCYLFLLRNNGEIMDNTHEYCAADISSEKDNLQDLPIDIFPWWMKKLKNHEIILVRNVSKMPEEASQEKEILQQQNIKSLLVLPVFSQGTLLGFIGFDKVKKYINWKKADIHLLQVTAQIFSSGIERETQIDKLSKSNQKHLNLLESSGEIIFSLDRELKFIFCNDNFIKANKNFIQASEYKLNKRNLYGKSARDFDFPPQIRRLIQTMEFVLDNGKEKELKLKVKDIKQNTRWFRTMVKPIKDKNKETNSILCIATDITSLKQMLKNEQNQRKVAERFNKLTFSLISDIKPSSLFKKALAYAKKIVNFDAADISILEEGCFSIKASLGYRRFLKDKKIQNINKPISLKGMSIDQNIIKNKKAIIISDTTKEKSWKLLPDTEWIRSNISIPIYCQDNLFGFLHVNSKKVGFFNKNDLKKLQPLANTIGLALENDCRYNKLQNFSDKMIQSITKIVEGRDPYTSGHQKNVSQLSVAIAKKMGLPKNQIEGIKYAALIHDIGKNNTPAEILNKPRKLTDLEFKMIQEHPKNGYNVLKESDFPWPLAEIIYQHHERLNGSGYPRGLKGEEILLEAKIIGVADTVEAMSSHRPYRPALGIKVALEEIKKNKNILYDPDVVDACVEVCKSKEFDFVEK